LYFEIIRRIGRNDFIVRSLAFANLERIEAGARLQEKKRHDCSTCTITERAEESHMRDSMLGCSGISSRQKTNLWWATSCFLGHPPIESQNSKPFKQLFKPQSFTIKKKPSQLICCVFYI